MSERITYEHALKDCLQDFIAMSEQLIERETTGKGLSFWQVRGQWESLVRNARNLYNRETSSYGDGFK